MDSSHSEDIYTNLHALVRLRYSSQGFNYLPRQSVRSLLSLDVLSTHHPPIVQRSDQPSGFEHRRVVE